MSLISYLYSEEAYVSGAVFKIENNEGGIEYWVVADDEKLVAEGVSIAREDATNERDKAVSIMFAAVTNWDVMYIPGRIEKFEMGF